MIRIEARARVVALALPAIWGAVAVAYELTCPLAQEDGLGARMTSSAVFFAVGTGLTAGVRRVLLRELAQLSEVAKAAQRVLLRPLPPRLDGLAVAAGQLSAHRGADVGGDLYEAVVTERGVRVVMGDVRGHGLAPIGTVAAVLGSFREAAHDERELAGVLRRLERALGRHVDGVEGGAEGADGEEFVTVLLLEIRPDGSVFALNCGHPWPYRLGRGVGRIVGGEPLPPLGPFPLPDALPARYCGRILPGEVLLLHTDGVEDARDAAGRFFPLHRALVEAAAAPASPEPDELVGSLRGALLRHTGGRSGDDMALLALRNDRPRVPRQGCAQTANLRSSTRS
ncbi:PP2C family protein-serine/threonine phosphatase [Streptomyces cavernicola]|uniref:PP2C family protein-serine/threonine phosphatase n=1 Tax=Streptomyces cavernicola TaxID=3043613 RepID=A0ABT6SGK1_9ACTN|nr:PP2C family protein-serine/threonine phosphatase [Streptomyces sp. B-S-A6]MDI3407114.1 PP2C family protein-serine/threonine phosphatase [Streptomyces sp. B-S-A6]